MKICDVVKNSIWFDPRVRKQIISYANNGFEVFGVGIGDERDNPEERAKMPCSMFLCPIRKWKRKTFLGKINRELESNRYIEKTIVKLKPDVIHANDLNALIPAYKAWKRLKKKPNLIYDTHELFLENPWMDAHKMIRFVWGYYEKKIFKKVDLLISVTQSAYDFLSKKYGEVNHLVVTNSVPMDGILKKKELGDATEILNQGTFYEGRGYELVIDAAKACQKQQYRFAIRGLGSTEKQLRARAEGVSNVIFYPPVKTSELIGAASSSTIGVAVTEPICLNFIYSVSNKIFEYAAAGLPVIMSDIPEHRNLNEKYGFGIIMKENNPKCFLEAVDTIVSSKKTYERLSANAIKMAKETCWESEFNKLIDFIGRFKR